jgi:hypothetical protein
MSSQILRPHKQTIPGWLRIDVSNDYGRAKLDNSPTRLVPDIPDDRVLNSKLIFLRKLAEEFTGFLHAEIRALDLACNVER